MVIILIASGLFSTLLIGPSDTLAASPGDKRISVPQAPLKSTAADTRVRLSWDTVKTMLETIANREEEKRNAPNADYLFGAATIDGDITEQYAELAIEVPLTLISDHFIKIPLVSTRTPVSRAIYNNTVLPLSRDGRYVCFEAGKEADREGILRLVLVAPVREKGGVNEFSVDSPLLQGGLVTLRFGTDIKSVQLFNVSWQKREGRVVKAALGPSRNLRGELATFLRKQETADETGKRVKKRYAATYTLASLEDEIATFYSSIRYRILNEDIRKFHIRLPEKAVVHEIVGEDLERWQAVKTENGITTYQIDVMYPVADRYDLSVRYETPVTSGDTPFTIPCLMVDGVARDTGHIGIEMRGRGGNLDLGTQ